MELILGDYQEMLTNAEDMMRINLVNREVFQSTIDHATKRIADLSDNTD